VSHEIEGLRDALTDASAWAWYFGRKCISPGEEGGRIHAVQAWLADCPAQEVTAAWGRRSGKSLALGEVMLPRYAIKHQDREQWIFSRTHEQARIIFDYAVGVLIGTPLEVYVDSVVISPYPTIRLRGGGAVHARGLGNGGDSARGGGGDIVYVDEAGFIQRSVVDRVVGPILANARHPQQVNISTPNGLDWFHEAFMRGQPGGSVTSQSCHMPSWKSPFINRSYLRSERARRSRMAWDAEYGALFMDDQAAQFPWSILQPVIDEMLPLPAAPRPDRSYVIGFDPAETHDRSGVVVLDATDSDDLQVVQVLDISRQPYTAQRQQMASLSARYGNARVLVDETNHRALLQEMVQAGVPAAGFDFRGGRKVALIDGLTTTIEQRQIRIPAHAEDLVTEMRFFRREANAAGNLKLGAPEDGMDDLTTALALAVAQARTRQPRARMRMVGQARR
jgi:Terminase large subunit, T4likevirus-type, N-terminal/Terminase RNaseH-like domain